MARGIDAPVPDPRTAPMAAGHRCGWARIRMHSPNKEIAPHLENPPQLANFGRKEKTCIIKDLCYPVFLALSLKEY
jgi:hypothetical protein